VLLWRVAGDGEMRAGEDAFVCAGGEEAAGAEEEGVGEKGDDFFDVMGDEEEGGGAAFRAEAVEEGEEVFAGEGIEAGARFVEDEEGRAGHEGAGDEDALAFALGEDAPGTLGEIFRLDLDKEAEGGSAVNGEGAAPVGDHGVATGDDGGEGGFVVGDALADAGADEADAGAEVAPVAFTKGLAEDGDGPARGWEVAGEGAEEGGFAGTVGTEDDPMLAGGDAPSDAVEDADGAALDGELADGEDHGRVCE